MMYSFNEAFEMAFVLARISAISIGVVGCILSFIVFSRKTFSKNSISTYSQALAIFECLTIIQLVQDAYRFTNQTTYFIDMNDISCKLFYYLAMQYTSIPGWILVSFSIDKMLNMTTRPLNILKSKRFQWSVVAGIVILHILIFSELLISLKQDPIIGICNFPFVSYFKLLIYAKLALSCLIPFLIMAATSIVTIRLLIKSRDSLRLNGAVYKERRNRDIKYAISAVAFNVFFIVFKIPLMINHMIHFSDEIDDNFMEIALFLFIFNGSSTFFIHLATNSIFRREFLLMFRFQKPTKIITSTTQRVR